VYEKYDLLAESAVGRYFTGNLERQAEERSVTNLWGYQMSEIDRTIQGVAATIRRKAGNSALIYGAIFAAGLLVTLGTLSSATKSGGTYFVFWGAIVFGLYGCVRAVIRYARADGEAAALVAEHIRLNSQH
jgi:hypothetical protein